MDHLEGRGVRSGRTQWTTWKGEGCGEGGLRGPPGRERGGVREDSMDHLEGRGVRRGRAPWTTWKGEVREGSADYLEGRGEW